MKRYKLIVEYDGGPFHGWQRQDDLPSVQERLEDAIHGFCGERVTLQCAGRTDAGVHALGQCAHADLECDRKPYTVMQGLNYHLKDSGVAITHVEIADPEQFHARFTAKGRRYVYRIINRSAWLALDQNRAWHVPKQLDSAALRDAAEEVLGTHDFTSFRDSNCQAKSPIKTLDELRVEQVNDQEINIHAASRSFLHHQVRIMTGSLVMVGKGKWTRADLAKARDAKERKAGGPTAPAHGLYFVEVTY